MAAQQEARDYVDSVMIQRGVEAVVSPRKVYSGRKRHLSLPEESCVKKLKNEIDTRDVRKARRVLYDKNTGESLSNEKNDVVSLDQNNLALNGDSSTKNKNCANASKNPGTANVELKGQGKKADKMAKGRKSAESGKDGMSDLLKAFNKIENRYSAMEKTMNKKFVDLEKVFQSKIDKFESQVMKKFADVMNTAVSTLKEELGEEIDELSQRIKKLEDREKVEQERMDVDSNSSVNLNASVNVIVRNLPERENESTVNEVNSLIKDGLNIRDITVVSAVRKVNSFDSSKTGVVVAKFRTKEEKYTVMKSKRKLKDSRRYEKVFIEHDLPRHQRVMNANIRTIVKTLGKENLEIAGARVKVRESSSDRRSNSYNGDRKGQSYNRGGTYDDVIDEKREYEEQRRNNLNSNRSYRYESRDRYQGDKRERYHVNTQSHYRNTKHEGDSRDRRR